MAEQMLLIGRVQIVHRGEYNPGTTYTLLDVVSLSGGSYMALRPVAGIAPPNATYWGNISLPGQDGRAVELRKATDYIQWRYIGETAWRDLVELELIKGPKGDDGGPGPKGDKGDKGEKGEAGEGFAVLDYFGSVSTLTANVPNPAPGDAYGVGLAAPYDIYVYGATSGWMNNGPLQGARGEKGETGEQGGPGPQGIQGPQGPQGAYAAVDQSVAPGGTNPASSAAVIAYVGAQLQVAIGDALGGSY